MPRMNCDTFDAEELARHLCGIGEDEDADVHDALQDRYGIGFDQFWTLISDLLPLVDVGRGPISGEVFQGFAAKGETHNTWLARMPRS